MIYFIMLYCIIEPIFISIFATIILAEDDKISYTTSQYFEQLHKIIKYTYIIIFFLSKATCFSTTMLTLVELHLAPITTTNTLPL